MRKESKHKKESIEKNRLSHLGKIVWNKNLKGWNRKYKNAGFQKGHKFHSGGEKGWFTIERCKGNTNGFKKGEGLGNDNYAKLPEVRKKISQKLRGRKNTWALKGENHPNYLFGLAQLPYSKEWTNICKKFIRKRDFWKCQICNNRKCKLSVHHIDYNKLNCNQDNLITLCTSCHAKTGVIKNRQYYEWQLKVFMNLFNNANNSINWVGGGAR